MLWIYIFEDGTIKQSPLPPKEADFACIGDGTLQIVWIDDGYAKELDWDGCNTPLESID